MKEEMNATLPPMIKTMGLDPLEEIAHGENEEKSKVNTKKSLKYYSYYIFH